MATTSTAGWSTAARQSPVAFGPAGYMPGNLFATVTENLEGLAAACESIWREGFAGERMVIRRIDDPED